jgi:hypothetical protein
VLLPGHSLLLPPLLRVAWMVCQTAKGVPLKLAHWIITAFEQGVPEQGERLYGAGIVFPDDSDPTAGINVLKIAENTLAWTRGRGTYWTIR